MDSCISQTLGASPAEPGGLPDWASVEAESMTPENKRFIEPDPERTHISLKDHLLSSGKVDVFVIVQLLKEQDWSLFEASYGSGGRPAYAPRLMTGLILYGVMQGRTSLRDLESMARDSLGCLWITGGIMPDLSLIHI